MSWSKTVQGDAEQVGAEITTAIVNSTAHDPALAEKSEAVGRATTALIAAAGSDVPDTKELYVSCWGHLDASGMSSYGLQVAHTDRADAGETVAASGSAAE